MKQQLETLNQSALQHIKKATTLLELEQIKTQYLGKKGQLTDILKGLGKLSTNERPIIGKLSNEIKTQLSDAIQEKNQALQAIQIESQLQSKKQDTSLPSKKIKIGHAHPLQQMIDELVQIFQKIGFTEKQGPEIETEYFNFEALNIPEHHPARDMHDTFYLNTDYLLRTHTSPVQIHTMKDQRPPLKIICPGKVYRCDADVTHSPIFHQIEGLYVDKKVTFADLKGTLEHFIHQCFGKAKKVRFRPSYFPFTEPSTEIDVECVNCNGKGCNICKQTGWLEILGAGMVNNNVFRSVGYDPDKVTGFAFGMGVERIAMLKYKIPDIRLFYENDIRFLKQF